jgi:ribonuclease P protein component
MDRLRQRADFLAVANGPRMNSAAFVVQSRARGDDGPVRVGFTVTKKVGTATERNRVRRRLRELVKRLDAVSMRPHSAGRSSLGTASPRPAAPKCSWAASRNPN